MSRAEVAMSPVTIMERHLDLAPLGGRRHGVTRCIFHEDQRPSLSVDLDRGLFNCFSCGAQGGLKRFRELVGEAPVATRARGHRPSESDWERAQRDVLARERRAAAKRAEFLHWSFANDYVRRCWNAARAARQIATHLGADHPRTWTLLERAAVVERTGHRIAADLDAIAAEGPLA